MINWGKNVIIISLFFYLVIFFPVDIRENTIINVVLRLKNIM